MKTQRKLAQQTSFVERGVVYAHYLSKYFNLFLNRFSFDGDIDYQQVAFIMREFWKKGTVACFKLKGSEGAEGHPNGLAVFAPYAASNYNIYNFPVEVTLVNLRGAKFIPTTPQTVDEDVVIGYVQRNKEPVEMVVSYYCRILAGIDMVLQTNLNAQKYPWIIGTAPESAEKMRQIADMLLEDNPTLFLELDEIDKAKALVSGAPYIIDKLHNYKIARENELREYLGLTNLGVGEKKEHLINSEVDANNEVTAAGGDVFLDCLTEFFERCKEVLGFDIKVKLNEPEPKYEDGNENPEEGREEDDPIE